MLSQTSLIKHVTLFIFLAHAGTVWFNVLLFLTGTKMNHNNIIVCFGLAAKLYITWLKHSPSFSYEGLPSLKHTTLLLSDHTFTAFSKLHFLTE